MKVHFVAVEQEITTYQTVQQGQETQPFQTFATGCNKDEAVESMNVRRVNEGGMDDVFAFKCRKIAKRGGFMQRRFTNLSPPGQPSDGCRSDEFLCGSFGKYDQSTSTRLTGLQCCYGENIQSSETDQTYEEVVDVTSTSKEIRSTRNSDAVMTGYEMM